MFIPFKADRVVKPEGDLSAKIAIIGDYSSAYDDKVLRPFQGTAGTVLSQCLHLAQLIRGEVYLTNLFKSYKAARPTPEGARPDLFSERTGKFTAAGQEAVSALQEELKDFDGNVIVTCGAAASAAVCGISKVSAKRGYVFPSLGLGRCVKVIPTFSPSQAVRGMYIYRHLITCDLKKAKQESLFPELRRPDRKLIYNFASLEEAVSWLDYFESQPNKPLSVDIEVINYEVSCINLSIDPSVACVIPIADRWTLEEEFVIWRRLDRLLGNPNTIKVLQNGIFDIQFMLARYGLLIAGEVRDTMIGHSCMYPELQKGLGFLGSIYCGSQEYWKDLAKFTNIKENS